MGPGGLCQSGGTAPAGSDLSLAHDLKTPSPPWWATPPLLHDDPHLTLEQRSKVHRYRPEKAQRLEELLGNSFDITRMDLGPTPTPWSPFSSPCCEQIADEFYPIFAEKNSGAQRRSSTTLWCSVIRTSLSGFLTTSLRNAVNYSNSRRGRSASLTLRDGQQVEIHISNEGLEILEGELANIFQKFYRLDAARSTRTGARAGLAIAKEIVERQAGLSGPSPTAVLPAL